MPAIPRRLFRTLLFACGVNCRSRIFDHDLVFALFRACVFPIRLTSLRAVRETRMWRGESFLLFPAVSLFFLLVFFKPWCAFLADCAQADVCALQA